VTTLTADQALAAAIDSHSLSRPGSSIQEIASRLVGLHNTSPVGPYLSIRARLPGFLRTDLDTLMWGSWHLARIRAMRLTIFVFPHELLEIAAAAARPLQENWTARWLRDSGLSLEEFERLADQVGSVLADGPATVRDLRRLLGVPQSVDLAGVVGRMCDVGRLVGGAPPGHWRSSIRRYHRWEDVLPGVDLRRWDEDVAVRELVHRYVRSYGPVTVSDISWWTGFTKQVCRTALEALDVEEVTVDGWPGPLFRTREKRESGPRGSEVRVLPLLDPYVQGYRDRVRLLDPARHEFVYDGGGNSTATVVQRGRIVGVWQPSEDPTDSIRYHLFDRGSTSVRRAAEAELAAAGSLYFDRPVDVIEVTTMKPLSAEGGRSASHPLDERLHRASRRATKPTATDQAE
jgi:hypothetical protein